MRVLMGSWSAVTTSGENIREGGTLVGVFSQMKTKSWESLFSQKSDRFSSGKCQNTALAMLHTSLSLYGHVSTALHHRQTKHVEHLSES